MKQPNIVFVLIDDLGWRDLGCYESGFYETPHIDRLARDAMRFTDAYAACPVCSPTRASILTGKYPATLGLTDFIGGNERGRLINAPYIDHLPLQEKTIAATLRDAGYRTWHVGKWHLGREEFYPQRHGFDVNVGGCFWGMPRTYFSPYGHPNLPDGPPGEYLTDRLTDEAIRLIKADSDRPFFLNLCHFAVHTPIQAKAGYIRKYEAKARALGLDKAKTFEEGDFLPCERFRHQRIMRRLLQSDPAYAAMIQSLDENIGRLLAALKDAGKADDTIVIFTSDNGGLATAQGSPTCNAPLAEGKAWMYEGGTRVPLLVKWPGVTVPGSVCRTPVTSPDFYPTLVDMVGLRTVSRGELEGVSLMPLLAGTGGLTREAIFWHYPHYAHQGGTPGSSVRCGDLKLIEFFEDGRLELYNLRDDIGEAKNLAKDNPGTAAALHRMLIDWRRKVGAKIPQPNPDWRERA